MNCTTHHRACECREAAIADLRDAVGRVAVALELDLAPDELINDMYMYPLQNLKHARRRVARLYPSRERHDRP